MPSMRATERERELKFCCNWGQHFAKYKFSYKGVYLTFLSEYSCWSLFLDRDLF